MYYLFGPHSPASDLKIIAVTAEVKGLGSADELGGMLRVNVNFLGVGDDREGERLTDIECFTERLTDIECFTERLTDIECFTERLTDIECFTSLALIRLLEILK